MAVPDARGLNYADGAGNFERSMRKNDILRSKFPRLALAADDEIGHEPGPSRLMRGTEPGTVVAVEVLVEEDEVAPVRVVLELGLSAVDRPAAARVAQQIAARERNATVVFVVCDRGDRYLSTGVFPA